MEKILITNDDGIDSDGLLRLVKASVKCGEVWVVAPDSQKSASSHAITLREHIDVYPVRYPVPGVTAYICSGTPADCVRVGYVHLMKDKPKYVFSGINYGYNSATDIQYSGTVGAALEGEFQGAYSVAFSERACECHEVTDRYLDEMIDKYLRCDLKAGQIVNINFPGCRLKDCRGVMENVKVSRGVFYTDRYKETEKLDGEGIRLMVDGIYGEECEEGTDQWALINNFVSVGIVNNYH